MKDNTAVATNKTININKNHSKNEIPKPNIFNSHNISNKDVNNEKIIHSTDFNFSNDLLRKSSSFNTEQELDNFILSYCKSNKKLMEEEANFIKTFAFLNEKKILILKNFI